MQKQDLLKQIAETGYNVGFGAKKHFATYDIVTKMPGLIGFISMGVGVFGLIIDVLATKQMSAIFIVLGIVGLLISIWNETIDNYENAGVELTKQFNRLKTLFNTTKIANDSDLPALIAELQTIESEYYRAALSKQIMFSNWYAHYKFFWEMQVGWIEEGRGKFRFIRDKIPLSIIFGISTTVVMVIGGIIFVIFDAPSSTATPVKSVLIDTIPVKIISKIDSVIQIPATIIDSVVETQKNENP